MPVALQVMARTSLFRLNCLVHKAEDALKCSSPAALLVCGDRQFSSASCSTSASPGSLDPPSTRSFYGQTYRAGRTVPEGYAEFTELQKLLQQYKRNLGAVGKAVSALKEQLWQQKGSMGEQFSHQQVLADSGRDQLAATEEELIGSLERSDLSQLAHAVTSLASLEQRPDTAILDAVASRLEQCLDQQRQQEPEPHELTEVLSGLAAMGYQPEPQLLDRVADIMAASLDRCHAKDISSLMNSLAAFGRTHFPLMSKVAAVVETRGSEFTSEALADILYTFAILNVDAQHMTDSILERIVYDLKSMSPASLSQLVSGLHLLNHRDAVTDVFLDELAEAALQQLQHFTARQLATLAYNYGTLNHWARNDQELLDAITIRMLHQHAELNPGELANLVWAIARASHLSPRTNALLAVVAGHAVEVADSFSPGELARLLHSLAMLSFYHRGLFERAEGLVREQLDSFSAEDLALTATAFARLMHEAPGLVPMVMTRLEGRFGELSATGLSGLVWGAAVLGHLTVPAFEAANQLLDAKNLQEFTARDFVRLFQAELLMEVQTSGSAPPPRLTEWLRGYAVRSLKDKLYLDRHAGNAQQEVCRCLMRLGIPYALEDKIDAFLAVDIVLRMPEHPKVAIKVEQVSKYTSSRPLRPLADAWVTRKLLQARGWKLICISEHDWVRMRHFRDKLAFLDEQIKAALAAPPALQAA